MGPARVWIKLLAYLWRKTCKTDASFKCFRWQMSSHKSSLALFAFSMSSSSTVSCSPLCSSWISTLPGSDDCCGRRIAAQKPPRCTNQMFSPASVFHKSPLAWLLSNFVWKRKKKLFKIQNLWVNCRLSQVVRSSSSFQSVK